MMFSTKDMVVATTVTPPPSNSNAKAYPKIIQFRAR
jgi:hypothetical protein